MGIMLGNLSLKQIEERCGVEFPDYVKEAMRKTHQVNADVKDGSYEWHGFYLPFCIYCGCVELATYLRDELGKLDWSKCRESLQIQYARYHQLRKAEDEE